MVRTLGVRVNTYQVRRQRIDKYNENIVLGVSRRLRNIDFDHMKPNLSLGLY